MLDAQLLQIFAVVVEAGGFRAAAERLGIDNSAVSRAIARLESQLGTRLIHRTTRRLGLTEAGEAVARRAQAVQQAAADVADYAGAQQAVPAGRLRVSCSASLGRLWLLPALPAFLQAHPMLEVQLMLEDRFVDLVAEQIDVALRLAHLEDSSLIARPLATCGRVLVAAPAYLARRSAPRTPAELAQHDCLVYAKGNQAYDRWTFFGPDGAEEVRVRGRVLLNDGASLTRLAVAGSGVLLMDRPLAAAALAAGELVELLPGYRLQDGFPLYAVYPARTWLPRKTEAFIRFVSELFGETNADWGARASAR